MNDSMTAIGMVRVIKRDKQSGEVVFDETFKNQITSYARTQAALVWTTSVSGLTVDFPTAMAIGTGTPPDGVSGTTPNDTGLWSEMANTRKNVDYAQQWLNYYTQYSVTYLQSEALGTVDPVANPTGQIAITEAGLFDAAGNLWSHVSMSGVTHDNTTTLSIQWQILQQGN